MNASEHDRSDVPPITPEIREAAKHRPGGYLYVVDAMYDPQGDVPAHGIKGAFAVDDNGEIKDFQANPGYRPSPVEGGQPPANWIDHGMRLAMAGRLEQAKFLLVIGGAVLPVLVSPQGDLMLLDAEQQGRCLMAYTASTLVPEDAQTEQMYLPRLLRVLPADAFVVVNGTAGLQARLPVADLVDSLREAQLLVDDPAGGLDIGPPTWTEQAARLAELVDDPTFTAIEHALVQWGKLSEISARRAQDLQLGITAVEILVRGGVSDPDVLAAAAAFRAVEPLHGGQRGTLESAAEAGVRVAVLLRSATSPQLPPGEQSGVDKLVYWVYVEHLRAMPWQPRAIAIANRLADIMTPSVPAERRENRRFDLAGPLLSCASDLPEGLRDQVAEHAGADPAGAEPLMLTPRPQEVITSPGQAVDRVRSALGTLADPVHAHDIGLAYRVESGSQPDHVYFVHKLWNTVTTSTNHARATDEYRAKYDVFPAERQRAA